MTPSYDRDALYAAAILETDRSKLKSRVDAAQAAIDCRLREMAADHGGSPQERYAIETTQAGLNILRKRVEMPHDPSNLF